MFLIVPSWGSLRLAGHAKYILFRALCCRRLRLAEMPGELGVVDDLSKTVGRAYYLRPKPAIGVC